MTGEIWQSIKGFEGKYQISNLGRVKSLSRYVDNGHNCRKTKEKFLNHHNDGSGYLFANLSLNGKSHKPKIHRLVAEHYINRVKGKNQVNHINGLKFDNRAANLEWVSQSENIQHAIKAGLKKDVGERSRSAKLTGGQVIEIYGRLKNGETGTSLAVEFDVTHSTIYSIGHVKNWKRVLNKHIESNGV